MSLAPGPYLEPAAHAVSDNEMAMLIATATATEVFQIYLLVRTSACSMAIT